MQAGDEGKRIFIRYWSYKLQTENFRCLYFNAWENDYSEDPLISFIGEMTSGIDLGDQKGTTAKNARSHIKKAKKLTGHIAERFIPVAAKITTSGLLDLDKVSERELIKLVGDLVKKYRAKYK